MLVGGFQKFSLIDYPGKISAIIFTQGCNFRCPYCHNPELVEPKLFQKPLNEEAIFSFLETRKGKLDAIVITGGEPTLQKDLPDFIRKIKSAGFLVKIDSNGTNPGMLKLLIEERLVNYIAMDIKAPLEKYKEVIHEKIDTNLIKESIEAIMTSRLDYEFRTTFAKEMFAMAEFISISKLIKGAKLYVLQKLMDRGKVLNPFFTGSIRNYSDEELHLIKQEVSNDVMRCIIR